MFRNESMGLFIFEKISPFITRIFAFGDLGMRTQSGRAPVLGSEMTVIHSTNTHWTSLHPRPSPVLTVQPGREQVSLTL